MEVPCDNRDTLGDHSSIVVFLHCALRNQAAGSSERTTNRLSPQMRPHLMTVVVTGSRNCCLRTNS